MPFIDNNSWVPQPSAAQKQEYKTLMMEQALNTQRAKDHQQAVEAKIAIVLAVVAVVIILIFGRRFLIFAKEALLNGAAFGLRGVRAGSLKAGNVKREIIKRADR